MVVFNQDRDLRYTWINSPALAWAEQDYMGRTDKEIVGGPEGDELMAIKRAVLDSGVGRRVETVVTLKGERHYFDLTVEPMRDSTGSIQGVTCSATDITPTKESLLERERLIARLQEALEEVKLLSGLLSMCASCKKITNERGDWEPLESYLQTHSQAKFSHGVVWTACENYTLTNSGMGAGGAGRQYCRASFRHPRGAITGRPNQEVKRRFDFPRQASPHHPIGGAKGDQSGLIGFGRAAVFHRPGMSKAGLDRRSQALHRRLREDNPAGRADGSPSSGPLAKVGKMTVGGAGPADEVR